MGSQKSKIPAGGMETRKTNKFWKLGARAAEGKPTYQNSRVKGIIKINKSFSEKLRLYMNKANGNVPELWKVTHENKHGRAKEQLANACTGKSKFSQSQQKQHPRRLMGPRGNSHIRGTRKRDTATAKKNEMNLSIACLEEEFGTTALCQSCSYRQHIKGPAPK